MLPSFKALASATIRIPKQHVPLIKFLGPRSKFNHENKANSKTISNEEVSQPITDKFGTKIFYLTEEQLSFKFRRSFPTQEESECIMLGGAF